MYSYTRFERAIRSALRRRAGRRDCAAWLDRELGVGRVVALERLRVARRFAELPVIESLFAAGTLS